MHVNENKSIETYHLPGLDHQTLAGKKDGLKSFEIWRQTIEAGANTPVHRHACEEVLVILKGEGVCRSESKEHHFNEGDTVVIPKNVVHQICNTGETDLHLLATLAMAPVEVKTEIGEMMPLPWDQ